MHLDRFTIEYNCGKCGHNFTKRNVRESYVGKCIKCGNPYTMEGYGYEGSEGHYIFPVWEDNTTTFTTTATIKTNEDPIDSEQCSCQEHCSDAEKAKIKLEKVQKERVQLKIDLTLTLASTIVCGLAVFSSQGATGAGWFTLLMVLIWNKS